MSGNDIVTNGGLWKFNSNQENCTASAIVERSSDNYNFHAEIAGIHQIQPVNHSQVQEKVIVIVKFLGQKRAILPLDDHVLHDKSGCHSARQRSLQLYWKSNHFGGGFRSSVKVQLCCS